MRRFFYIVLLAATCSVMVQAQLGGAPSNISKEEELDVRVTYENGRPVGPNVRVELLGVYGGTVQFAMTDTSSMVRFTRLDPAKYDGEP